MFHLINNRHHKEPSINLALEEYAALNLPNDRSYCLFYTNKPCVVVGKNQNVFEEIQLTEAEKRNIAIIRRISGGGAVFHDEGNLNFSFLTPNNTSDIANWRKFSSPIIQALQSLNINAELNYRNDIVVGEFKISGTAQYTGRNLMISHGTLLLNADLKALSSVLTPHSGQIKSKSLKSFRSKVKNLSEFMENSITMDDFRAKMIQFACAGSLEVIEFTENQWTEIYQLAKEKYQTWEWNIGWSPAFEMEKEIIYADEMTIFSVKIARGGTIEEIIIPQTSNLTEILKPLIGLPLKKEVIENALKNFTNICEQFLK